MTSSFPCIAHEGLPRVRRCRVLGEHRVTCPDHPGWANRPGLCGGCLGALADRGHLCAWHWEFLQGVYIDWARFRQLVEATEGRVVSADSGGIKGSTPAGFTNLTLVTMTLDECDRLLESLHGQTLDAWVHTEQGARDALMFAYAAKSAYDSMPVDPAKERAARIEKKRCPHCDMLHIGPNPTRVVRGATEVYCQWPDCGKLLDTIRDHSPLVVTSEACETGDHHTCPDVNCRCDCHLERNRSLYTVTTPAHLLGKDGVNHA